MASFENENQNFFAGFQEWDWLKVTYISFHVLLTFIVPTLLYSICWYERYSPDLQYRMVSNILLSHTCWIGIFRSFFARIPAVIFFTSGPFAVAVCDSFSIIAKYLFVIYFNELAIWQFVRFICPNESMMKLNQMLWHGNATHVPRLGKLILADPVVKLFQIESILIFFFAAVSYCMINKDKVRIKYLMA